MFSNQSINQLAAKQARTPESPALLRKKTGSTKNVISALMTHFFSSKNNNPLIQTFPQKSVSPEKLEQTLSSSSILSESTTGNDLQTSAFNDSIIYSNFSMMMNEQTAESDNQTSTVNPLNNASDFGEMYISAQELEKLLQELPKTLEEPNLPYISVYVLNEFMEKTKLSLKEYQSETVSPTTFLSLLKFFTEKRTAHLDIIKKLNHLLTPHDTFHAIQPTHLERKELSKALFLQLQHILAELKSIQVDLNDENNYFSSDLKNKIDEAIIYGKMLCEVQKTLFALKQHTESSDIFPKSMFFATKPCDNLEPLNTEELVPVAFNTSSVTYA